MSGRELSCEGFQQAKERGTVLGRGKAGISSADCVTFTKKRQHWSTISLFGPTEFANLCLIDLVGTKPYKIWTRPQVVPKSSNTMGSLSTGPCLPRLSSASRRDLRSIPLIDFLMPLFGKQSGKFPQNPVLILVDILLAFLNYHETGG